jgi:hypothetical protein
MNMKKGESKLVELHIMDIYSRIPNIDSSKNLIAINVQNDVISQGKHLKTKFYAILLNKLIHII